MSDQFEDLFEDLARLAPANNGDDSDTGAPETGGRDTASEPPPVIADEFWSARPVLRHIRLAAQAAMAAPDATFVSLLANVAVRVPPGFRLPPLVGGPGSLNICASAIGISGLGKGSAMRCAENLLPEAPPGVGVGPLGTGPGMVDVYFAKPADGGEPARAKAGWLFVADEGQTLTKLAEGQGSVTLEYIRQGWSGERIGGQTVSAPWRVLAPHSYRMAVLLGLQPALARPLLADVDGGTPQRFIFASAVDPHAPAELPQHPGAIAWECPDRPGDLTVAEPIRSEIIARRREVLTGQRIPDPYDAHRDLNRLKVAGLLALLEQRTHVGTDDWELAGMVLDASDGVRSWVLASHRAAEARDEAERLTRAAARARAEEAARRRDTDDVVRIARVIERAVTKHGPTTRGRLRAAVKSGPDRERFDDALAHAEAQGWIEQDDHGAYRRPGA